MPNCSQATCEGNNVITLQPRPCPQVQEPTCANGYPAVKVADEDGCCQHYQCQCEPRVGRGLAGAGPGWGRGGEGGHSGRSAKGPPNNSAGTIRPVQRKVPLGEADEGRDGRLGDQEPGGAARVSPPPAHRCVQRLGRPALHHL